MSLVLKKSDINYNVSRDYGKMLRNFKKDYMDFLIKKTTLIIVGNGCINYMNLKDEMLGQVLYLAQSRTGKFVWFWQQ